jgi:glycosyltransferase involved in cell wall biosynthesis
MPKVTVITLCFNYGHYLVECLESVQAQTFKDFEHIVINSGSTDNSSEVARQYPIRLTEIEDRGLSSSRNHGVNLASGEYIVNLDADDTIHPQFLEKMVAKAASKTVVAPMLYGCNFTIQDIELANQVICCSMFCKNDFDAVGGYDPDLDWIGLEDWSLWCRLKKYGCNFVGAPEAQFYYRIHEGSSSKRLAHTDSVRYPYVIAKNIAWQPR